ncbi:hypothetical protein EVA_10900 [gut metagenome]|uniref:Uncharacterized protein n=1 Tax=gut metagenome TaxID=749906 RepID=J9G177_9ZZZZ
MVRVPSLHYLPPGGFPLVLDRDGLGNVRDSDSDRRAGGRSDRSRSHVGGALGNARRVGVR